MALFEPFRALGCITDDVPFAVQRRGQEAFVTVAVGNAWQTFNCAKLLLVAASPQMPGAVAALTVKDDLTLCAVGADIIIFRRLHAAAVLRAHAAAITQLLVLADVLLSLAPGDHALLVWSLADTLADAAAEDAVRPSDGEGKRAPLASGAAPIRRLRLPAGFVSSCMVHPETYVNKVVVGSTLGALQLWNFSSGALLYTFAGWGAGVTALAPAPAVDVIAVGLADGRVVLHDIRTDVPVATFIHGPPSGGAVRCLAFRTGPGPAVLAVGGASGAISVWDLRGRKLACVTPAAHDAPVTSLHFFVGEPRFMSSGADNALKQWLLEDTAGGGAEGMCRLLRSRAGHASPPTVVTHYGGDGARLLSSGRDRSLRVSSVHQDQQSRELSQGHVGRRAVRLRTTEVEVKLPEVRGIAAGEVRERDWANVVTCHAGLSTAHTWQLTRGAIGEHELHPPTAGGAEVTCVAVSACGNYGFTGTANGWVDRFNLQSGAHRGGFTRTTVDNPALPVHAGMKPGPGLAAHSQRTTAGSVIGRGRETTPAAVAAAAASRAARPAHDGPVVGLACDPCNKRVVSVGLDGTVRVWHFGTRGQAGEMSSGVALSHVAAHGPSSLLAAAGDDLMLRVWDTAACTLVRRLRGHTERVTAVTFASDARWLLSAGLDGSLRVWDLPAGRLLQSLRVDPPITALSLSPQMDMLATLHVNRRGMSLWSNRLLYAGAAGADVPLNATTCFLRLPTLEDTVAADAATEGGAGEAGGADASSALDASANAPSANTDAPIDADTSPKKRAAPADEDAADNGDYRSAKRLEMRDGASPTPLAPELVTLALLPRSQWQALVHLEAIKARNKPTQPPTKPASAPFFLPTVASLSAQPVFSAADAAPPDAGGSRIRDLSRMLRATGGGLDGAGTGGLAMVAPLSPFATLLAQGSRTGDWSPLAAHLRSLPASAIDGEVRSLAMAAGGNPELLGARDAEQLAQVMDYVASSASGGGDYELLAAFTRLFLDIHGDLVAGVPTLRARGAALGARLGATWRRLDGLFQSVSCMLSLFAHVN